MLAIVSDGDGLLCSGAPRLAEESEESINEVAGVEADAVSEADEELDRTWLKREASVCMLERIESAGIGDCVREPRRRGLNDSTSSSFSLVLS